MKLKKNRSRLYFLLAFVIFACNNRPKVIEPSKEEPANSNSELFEVNPEIQVTPSPNNPFGDELHKVMVKEVLPASRYVYLKVQENQKSFWIATRRMDVATEEMYFYRGGLLKTQFESKEHNRMFDTIYLVSNLVSSDHSKHMTANDLTNPKTSAKQEIETHTEAQVLHKGTVKIADLVKNPKKYEGHTIQIHGKCVKVNPDIMQRNWIHVQDGSMDNYDLVVTSNSYVPEGKDFTMKAKVSLNRDFGAGYTYDLILEDGILIE